MSENMTVFLIIFFYLYATRNQSRVKSNKVKVSIEQIYVLAMHPYHTHTPKNAHFQHLIRTEIYTYFLEIK